MCGSDMGPGLIKSTGEKVNILEMDKNNWKRSMLENIKELLSVF